MHQDRIIFWHVRIERLRPKGRSWRLPEIQGYAILDISLTNEKAICGVEAIPSIYGTCS
jgi:hypothetical protein